METIAITGQPRTDLGKRGTKVLRKEGHIPCVAYGSEELVHFSVNPIDVKHLIYTPDFKIAEVTVDGKAFRAIVKDIQFHPVTDEILHLDFLQLEDGRSVKLEVPIRFKGTSPGVKSGGKLIQRLRRIKIKTMPENIVDQIMVDISHLELNQSIRVRDIEGIDTIEIMNSPGVPIASVETPRALRSAASAAAKAATGEEEEA